MARSRLARGDLKARLCEISCMARNRFWFAVAPTTYAVTKNCHDSMEVLRRKYAHAIWRETTAKTRYLVRGSWPQSFSTCLHLSKSIGQRAAHTTQQHPEISPLMSSRTGLAYLWMGFDDSLPPCSMWFLGVCPEEMVFDGAVWRRSSGRLLPRRCAPSSSFGNSHRKVCLLACKVLLWSVYRFRR